MSSLNRSSDRSLLGCRSSSRRYIHGRNRGTTGRAVSRTGLYFIIAVFAFHIGLGLE